MNINNDTSSSVQLEPLLSQTESVDSTLPPAKKKPPKSKTASIPGKPRGATYDGNICMICSDRASGFHYGVLACEGCKGFFKRVCKEKPKSQLSDNNNNNNDSLSSKRHCVFGGNCEINVRTRNRCQYCRIQKCIELGMSKDGIKLGRRSKKFKQNLTNSLTTKTEPVVESINQELANSSTSDLNKQQIFAILQDNKLIIKAIDILSAVAASTNHSPQEANIENSKNILVLPASSANTPNSPVVLLNNFVILNTNSSVYSMLEPGQLATIRDNVFQAYKNTNNIYSIQQVPPESSIESNLTLHELFSQGLTNLLNKSKLLEHINTLIENTVLFAKNVPYFMNINETDRISLLKSSVFEVICVRHAVFWRSSSNIVLNDLATLATCAVAGGGRFLVPIWNVWTASEWLCEKMPQMSGFIKMLFEFYFYFNTMNLTDFEFALLCSFLLFNTDDQSIGDLEKLTNNRNLYYDIVVNELEKSRAGPSVSKTNEERNQTKDQIKTWLTNCCTKLKELNLEHARILLEQKQYVQFPDLYAELYNL